MSERLVLIHFKHDYPDTPRKVPVPWVFAFIAASTVASLIGLVALGVEVGTAARLSVGVCMMLTIAFGGLALTVTVGSALSHICTESLLKTADKVLKAHDPKNAGGL